MGLIINGVEIEDTFAEAFKMWGTRVIITAKNRKWALQAAVTMTGFATSVIGCKCEAGIESELADTPDGRPGVSVLLFTPSRDDLSKRLIERIGQCVMTCPTTACFNGLKSNEQLKIGGQLRYFGDGYQGSKLIGGRRFWRIPVMEGEFLIEDKFGIQSSVGGGNFLILGNDLDATLEASERAVEAMKKVSGAIMPFPGGIVRSGSKVKSRYKFLIASTNDAYCPTLRGAVDSALAEGENSVLEIVIDGLDEESVVKSTRAGIRAACIPGIRRITAGNYGGNLGQFKIHLHQALREGPAL
ncbi:MAG TPA: formylmethanofuran--tetrahydromethanopterin N-formyltransferase [Anaerolineaceae bacterium]|nr:formylmethanofuran--tetrahydromethanopterin N-formyltransferase [Anaerolineaceae bacterium]